MSVENREFERYLEYQQSQRTRRVETLGTAATALVLSTFDLGISPLHEPEMNPRHVLAEETQTPETSVVPMHRHSQLGRAAIESAELGYAQAA